MDRRGRRGGGRVDRRGRRGGGRVDRRGRRGVGRWTGGVDGEWGGGQEGRRGVGRVDMQESSGEREGNHVYMRKEVKKLIDYEAL